MAASAAVEMEAGGRGGKDGGGRDVDKWLREPALQRERLPCSSAASQIADFEVTHNCGKKASIFRYWNMGSGECPESIINMYVGKRGRK